MELEPLAWTGWDEARERDKRHYRRPEGDMEGSGESCNRGYSNRCPEKGAEPSRQILGKTYVFQYHAEETEVRTAASVEGISTQLMVFQFGKGSWRRHPGCGAERDL